MSEQNLHILGPFDSPGGPRHVRVFVPPQPGAQRHSLQGATRPLLCMFDGQNVFDDAPSYSGGWHLHETVSRFAARGHAMPVVVGIDHGGARRIHELSPFACRESEGRADEFLEWVLRVALPHVKDRFGLETARERTFVGGSSLGGLAALYAHFRHPESFGGALAMSPSCWLAGGKIESFLAESPRPEVSRIYLDAGALEARGMMLSRARRVADLLKSRGWGHDQLHFVEDREGTHSESHWRRRADGALAFLFDAHEQRLSHPHAA